MSATPAALLEVRDLRKSFGGLRATDGVSLDVAEGETHALIGPNGAGKTTLVAQLFGELRPDSGTVLMAGRDVTRAPPETRASLGMARSFQIVSVVPGFTALGNVALAVRAVRGPRLAPWRRAASCREACDRARDLLALVGLASAADLPAAALSHGQRKHLEIAMALAAEPRLVLLDEPLAGVGQEEQGGLVSLLATLKGRVAVLLIEHDMDAVFRLADRVTVLAQGRVVASGDPAAVRADPEVKRVYLGDGEEDGAAHG